jgi:hypothetical protein
LALVVLWTLITLPYVGNVASGGGAKCVAGPVVVATLDLIGVVIAALGVGRLAGHTSGGAPDTGIDPRRVAAVLITLAIVWVPVVMFFSSGTFDHCP